MAVFDKSIFIFGLILLSLDYLWLKNVMIHLYKEWFRKLSISMDIKMVSIVLAYAIMISVYPLFIQNVNKDQELRNSIFIGGIIFGLYGFTVSALFPHYDIHFAVLETTWGMFLYGVSTFMTRYLIEQ